MRKKGKFIPEFLQQQFDNLKLDNEKDVSELNSKMLMLWGPSGSGKSTLATIIAKKCGYNPYRIALGNEGSPDALLATIKTVLEGKSITESTKGPSLLILDDMDSFFMNNPTFAFKVLELIVKRPSFGGQNKAVKENTDTAKGNEDSDDDKSSDHNEKTNNHSQTNDGSKTNSAPINSMISKRPVIFICEDAFSKGLRPLKNVCHQFKLEKSGQALIEKLKHVCMQEVKCISIRVLVSSRIS